MRDILITGIIAVVSVGMVGCATEEPVVSDVLETPEAELAEIQPESVPAAPAPAPRATAPAPAPARVAPTPVVPAAPPLRVFEVPEGTTLTFTLIDSLSTETSQPGQTFQASLSEPLVVDGRTLAAKNALATGRVVSVNKPGKVSGVARIELVMTSLDTGSETISLETESYVAQAETTKGEDATKIGAGAGIGAAIGAALGGGKGAALGAAIGGGGGTAVVLATSGDQVELPSESRVSFRLGETLRITEGGRS